MADPFEPLGAEFLVDTQTGDNLFLEPTLTGLADGRFVLTWTTYDTTEDGSGLAIKGQVFDATGAKQGSKFLVNSQTAEDQKQPTITELTNGRFVVAWNTNAYTQDGYSSGIKAQIFDASGEKLGSEFLVDSSIGNRKSDPTITALNNGGFVVAWQNSNNSSIYRGDIKAQIFDASGAKQGTEFLVNSQTVADQSVPSITGLTNGEFVATWQTADGLQDGSQNAIKGQVFSANGAKQGVEFLINTETLGHQYQPAVTDLTGGGFVVSWWTRDSNQDGSGFAVKGQIFAANGVKVGTEFLVNSQVADDQYTPSITSLSTGGFVVVWQTDDHTPEDGKQFGIKAQVFDASGVK